MPESLPVFPIAFPPYICYTISSDIRKEVNFK